MPKNLTFLKVQLNLSIKEIKLSFFNVKASYLI